MVMMFSVLVFSLVLFSLLVFEVVIIMSLLLLLLDVGSMFVVSFCSSFMFRVESEFKFWDEFISW